MGNILSAIHDDIDNYLDLCEKFNEEPQRSPRDGFPDCYGPHSKALRARELGETLEPVRRWIVDPR